ncbi:hypothetical protein D3C84_312790 [compost metagenome]
MGDQGQQILTGSVPFGHLDRVEDELQVGADQVKPWAGGCRLSRQRRDRPRRCAGTHRCASGRHNSFEHAMLVLIDRPGADAQSLQIGGHGEALTDCRQAAKHQDVLEEAIARHQLDLPVVGNATGNRVARTDVVAIDYIGNRGNQCLPYCRRTDDFH